MDFAVGDLVEAVDDLGIWAKGKIVENRENSVLVTFPPWNSEWNREIQDKSEIRKRTDGEVLIPRHLRNKKSPNLQKLLTGDVISLAGEEVKVHWSDPIRKRVMVRLCDGSHKIVNVWEVEELRAEEQEEVARKRKRKKVDQEEPVNTTLMATREQHIGESTECDTLQFCFHVSSNVIIRIGSFYTLAFSGNSIFVCTEISRRAKQFSFSFMLCSFDSDTVHNLLPDVTCILRDVNQISCRPNVTCNSKVRNLVDKLICEGWDRVYSCQESQIGNISYLTDLRKSCLAGQIRQGVWSGIARNATRPAQPLHLGVFDPVMDSKIFDLSIKNHFQVTYKGKELVKLDTLLGSQWDVKILEPGNPQSHFKYVCRVRLFVHKPSMGLRFNFVYSESSVPFTAAYRSTCFY